ncbi:MAG: hypothetical protein P8M34_12755 [Saprospiraceae bacterium]|nr:hypothetical protein [Saprospiraceae bacterium]
MSGQETLPLRLSYFSPFGVNRGIKVGVVLPFDFKNNKSNQILDEWNVVPHIAYFVLPDIQNNLLTTIGVEYGNAKKGKGFYTLYSIELGYLLSFKKYGGIVQLESGNIQNNIRLQHSFLPEITVGLGYKLINGNGLFMKLFYGRQLSIKESDASFLGAEIGIQIHIKR